MLQDSDSSGDSDAAGDSIFLGRRRRMQRSATTDMAKQSSLDTPTSEVLNRSISSPVHSGKVTRRMVHGVSMDEGGERHDSLTVHSRAEAEVGGSVQGSHKGTPRGSRQGSPVPGELSDYVVVSKGEIMMGV